MRIGFDAKRAIFNMTGLGNYSRSLIHALSRCHPENQYFLYSPGWKDNPRLSFLRDASNAKVVLPNGVFSGPLRGLWRSTAVRLSIARDKCDIFHGLSNELPVGIKRSRTASVVTIHDLIFLRYPQYYSWIDRQIYELKSRHACRASSVIVAVSEQTKRDIIEYLGIVPDKIRVIYQSCDPGFTRSVGEVEKTAVRSRYNLPAQFVLYVGSIEERKNLLGLVKAVESLRKTHDLFLLAIGNGNSYKELVQGYINSAGMNDRIQIRSDIAFSDFPAIYQMAQALVYPSHFEGFGIPIIEALWSKTPVITSRGGCFSEAAGPSSVYVSPESSEEIASALVKVLGESTVRAKMIAGGLAHVHKFREEVLAQQMMDLYTTLT